MGVAEEPEEGCALSAHGCQGNEQAVKPPCRRRDSQTELDPPVLVYGPLVFAGAAAKHVVILDRPAQGRRLVAGLTEGLGPQPGVSVQVGLAISYALSDVQHTFQGRFPGYVPPSDWSTAYDSWATTVIDTLRGTLDTFAQALITPEKD